MATETDDDVRSVPSPVKLLPEEIASVEAEYGTLGVGFARIYAAWERKPVKLSVFVGEPTGKRGQPRTSPDGCILKTFRIREAVRVALRQKFGGVNAGARAVVSGWMEGKIVDRGGEVSRTLRPGEQN